MASAVGFGYVADMFKVEVAMYWARWVLDEGQGHQFLSITQGLVDIFGRWVVSQHCPVREFSLVRIFPSAQDIFKGRIFI